MGGFGVDRYISCNKYEIALIELSACHFTLWRSSYKTLSEAFFFREGWATCPSGHFLNGFHRGGSHQLKSIQWAQCCKPALQPHWYKECKDQDVGAGDTWKCNDDGFYVVGLHRGTSETLTSITKLRCCSMYDGEKLSF